MIMGRDGDGTLESHLTEDKKQIETFFVVTGISGSGKSTALNIFEDNGFFVIDNIPPDLLLQLIDILQHHSDALEKGVAAGVDVRGSIFLEKFPRIMQEIRNSIPKSTILFFDAEDQVILKRYEKTRRRHPFKGNALTESIQQERELLTSIKSIADEVVDTSDLSISQLQRFIQSEVLSDKNQACSLEISSFGFKYGMPRECNYVFDVRFMPNPFYCEKLRYLTGKDSAVQNFVFQYPETTLFFDSACSLLNDILPYYLNKGKNCIHIAVGCTGGRHRSVAVVERMREYFLSFHIPVRVCHRDIGKEEY